MGLQAHLTRLCLGRSAFEPLTETVSAEDETLALHSAADSPDGAIEPAANSIRQVHSVPYQQQYDRKGYPENSASRALARQSRRAINDILTTVGVCVGVDGDGELRPIPHGSTSALDKVKIAGVIRENEIGMLVGFIESTLDVLAGVYTIGLRCRIQTFRFYRRVTLTTIITSEWIDSGLLKGLFAGIPADIAYSILDVGQYLGMDMLLETLAIRFGIFDSGFPRHMKWSLLKIAGRLWVPFLGMQLPSADIGEIRLNMTILGLLTPFKIYSTLQYQGLLPAWPLFPHPKAFVPFSPSSPLRLPALPDRLDGTSCLQLLASLACNPLVLLGLREWMRPRVQDKVHKYTRAALPAPDFPDVYSIEAANEDDIDKETIAGLGNAAETPELWESRSVQEQLAKDLQYIGRSFQILRDSFWGLFPRKSRNPSTSPAAQPLPSPTPTPALVDPLGDDASPPSPSYDPSSSSPSRPSSPRPQIEITGSTTSSGTVHMSVAIPVPISSLARRRRHNTHPPNPSSPSSPGPSNIRHRSVQQDPYYRITTLSSQAAYSMSHRLSGYITGILLFPLEALYVRSVALSFLSSPAATVGAKAAAERWKGEVYPLGRWFGMGLRGGWMGAADYAGKMVLVQGMEMGMGLAVWQMSVGLSWWVGRKWFEWGRL